MSKYNFPGDSKPTVSASARTSVLEVCKTQTTNVLRSSQQLSMAMQPTRRESSK